MKHIILFFTFLISLSVCAQTSQYDGKRIEELKLAEAKALQIDTLPAFKRDVKRFRNEAAKGFLIPEIYDEELLKQVFREWGNRYYINNIIISIPFAESTASFSNRALPADTLQSYKIATEAYKALKAGADFEETTRKFSSEKNIETIDNPGYMKGVSINFFPYRFKNSVYNLQQNEISKPFRTSFGYHIVKLLSKEEAESIVTETYRHNVITELKKQDVGMRLQLPYLNKLKHENGFKPNKKAYAKLTKAAVNTYPLDKSFFQAFEHDRDVLFNVEDSVFVIADFINYFERNKNSPFTLSTELLQERVFMFELEKLKETEFRLLEHRKPEFAEMMRDYEKGLMIFEVTNREVWSKAAADTAGLRLYFEQNKSKYQFTEPHFKGFVVHAKTLMDKNRMLEEIKDMPLDAAYAYLRASYITSDTVAVKLGHKRLFIAGEDEYIDELIFGKGKGVPYLDFPRYFVVGELITEPHDYTDVLARVVDDYQNYMEAIWLDKLK